MKNLFKTVLVSAALLAATGTGTAQEAVDVDEALIESPTIEPGYSEVIEMATVPALDETVEFFREFKEPNLFMSDPGVYRYAYYEKTGEWLTRAQAEAMMNDLSL